MNTTESLLNHPELKSLFKDCESRHLKDAEFDLYLQVVPEFADRVKAAREMKEVDGAVVKKVILGIYALYPYEQFHQLALAKCIRDVRYVTAYATQSMLMGDPQWFADKLLIWLKTILQAFRFPDLPAGQNRRLNPVPAVLDHLQGLKPFQRSIYETYYGVKMELKANLSPESYALMEPYLQQPIDILAHD